MSEFKNSEDLLFKIESLKKQGYNRIHLPGGTSKDGSFYSGVVIHKYDPETKDVYFIGIPYNTDYHIDHPSGHNKKADEKPEETAGREVQEEVGPHVHLEDLELIMDRQKPDNRPGYNGKFHYQYFYLLKKLPDGYQIPEYDEPNHIDGETTAPLWIPSGLFLKILFGGHIAAVKVAIDKLMNENRNYAYALMNLA